uniref:Bet v I/Major latex protein domain-containing protein n=1 Tax=Lotus japonicus TaxID=34305 RepID=I3SFB3_LOTJA|nr:unknown [Lotus japonicus]
MVTYFYFERNVNRIDLMAGGESKYMLHRVDEVDEKELVYNFSIIGGTGLADPLEKVQFKSKFVEGPNGGCIRGVQAQYFTKGDTTLSEETVKASQAKVNGIVKIAEGFLLANPDYN